MKLTLLLLPALVSAAYGQKTTFSIDGHGPTNSTVPCAGGATVHQGDLIRPNTTSLLPELATPSPVCVDARGGFGLGTLGLPLYPTWGEVDALSYGEDALVTTSMPAGSFMFSVDEYAAGHPIGAGSARSVRSEAMARDCASSAFLDTGIAVLPYPLAGGPLTSVEAIDGDGLPSTTGYAAPGLGLVEPNSPGSPPDPGDNLDALDADGKASGTLVLFSLDGALFDPLAGVAGTNSAVFNGYLPGQILASNLSGAMPTVWAGPGQLGLIPGAPSDDIDALAILDNGNQVYDPAMGLFAWGPGGDDMVLFSLRRGSATLGAPDSFFGIPIEEGDVLTPPVPGGLNTNPAILIPAEALGLATIRSGTAKLWAGVPYADDLDALDVTDQPVFDCDGNAQEDAIDIFLGLASDLNLNGVPDPCETVTYCTAGTSASGCQALIGASGTASATAPSGFVLSGADVEGAKQGMFFFGTGGRQANSWGNGTSYQCVVPPVKRGGVLTGSGTVGVCDGSFAQDLNTLWTAVPIKNPGAGARVQAQLWYRDSLNTSNQSTSLSDAIEFVVGP